MRNDNETESNYRCCPSYAPILEQRIDRKVARGSATQLIRLRGSRERTKKGNLGTELSRSVPIGKAY